MNVLHILKRLLKKDAAKESKLEVERVPFPELRFSMNKLSGLMAEATSDINRIFLDLEDYGAESWRRERETTKRYRRIVDSLFLLLDHLENLAVGEKKPDETEWLYTRICRILEDEAIEEIQVGKGEPFNGIYHKQVESRPDDLPRDAVLEVSRKGYFVRGQPGQDDAILRPAEVIVSNGSLETQPESKISKKVKK